jgi:hypothetical protein
VQFYPDAIVHNCSSAGGFNVTYAPDKFSVCTPVWQLGSKSFAETAANGSKADKWAVVSDFGPTPWSSADRSFGPEQEPSASEMSPSGSEPGGQLSELFRALTGQAAGRKLGHGE